MAKGQEYAQILPRSNAAGLFAQNFLRSRQTAEQRDILRQQQEMKLALDKKKQDDADINELLKFKDGLSAGFKDVKEHAREGVDQTLVEMHKALTEQIQSGQRDPIKFRQIASQYTDKATEIKRWGDDVDKAGDDLTKYYTPIPGVNANGVKQLVNLAVTRAKRDGLPPPNKEKIAQFVDQNIGELIDNKKGFTEPFKEIGTQTIGIGTGNNGKMTAGKSTMTIPVDAELDGKGLGTRVIPKGETVALASLNFGVGNANNRLQKFKGMDNLADQDGNLHLYDENHYASLMENKGAQLLVDKLFKAHVKQYEESNGQPFPMSEQIVDMTKRAIVYKERAELVDGKYNAVAPQPVYHHTTVVNNNGGKASEAVTVRKIQEKIDRAVALYPNGVLSIKLPGDQGRTVLDQAAQSQRDPEKIKKMNSSNVGVRATPEGSMIYWVNDAGVKEDLHLMEESATDIPLNPGIKEKKQAAGGGSAPTTVSKKPGKQKKVNDNKATR